MNNYGRETRQEHAPVLRNERESHSLPTFEPSEKLRGYDWYRSIGSPRCVAPMVDQSELVTECAREYVQIWSTRKCLMHQCCEG